MTVPTVSSTSLVTNVEISRPRQTPPPASREFREVLGNAASGLLQGVESVAGFVPGGSMVSAALRTAGEGGLGPSAEAPSDLGGSSGSSSLAALSAGTDQTLALLELQHRMSMEQRHYMAVSNAMKARHDTAKNVLGNVR